MTADIDGAWTPAWEFGESAGHPFRGNQWTGGIPDGATSLDSTSARQAKYGSNVREVEQSIKKMLPRCNGVQLASRLTWAPELTGRLDSFGLNEATAVAQAVDNMTTKYPVLANDIRSVSVDSERPGGAAAVTSCSATGAHIEFYPGVLRDVVGGSNIDSTLVYGQKEVGADRVVYAATIHEMYHALDLHDRIEVITDRGGQVSPNLLNSEGMGLIISGKEYEPIIVAKLNGISEDAVRNEPARTARESDSGLPSKYAYKNDAEMFAENMTAKFLGMPTHPDKAATERMASYASRYASHDLSWLSTDDDFESHIIASGVHDHGIHEDFADSVVAAYGRQLTAALEFGESTGHPFRGNQWKDGESGSDGGDNQRMDAHGIWKEQSALRKLKGLPPFPEPGTKASADAIAEALKRGAERSRQDEQNAIARSTGWGVMLPDGVLDLRRIGNADLDYESRLVTGQPVELAGIHFSDKHGEDISKSGFNDAEKGGSGQYGAGIYFWVQGASAATDHSTPSQEKADRFVADVKFTNPVIIEQGYEGSNDPTPLYRAIAGGRNAVLERMDSGLSRDQAIQSLLMDKGHDGIIVTGDRRGSMAVAYNPANIQITHDPVKRRTGFSIDGGWVPAWEFGENAGHPFRGNQWTAGDAGDDPPDGDRPNYHGADGKAYADWTDADKAAFDKVRAQDKVWGAQMQRSIFMGTITPKEAAGRGWFEHTGGSGDFRELPDTLYHVTTSVSGVEESGLKTRDELGQERGAGLGGGPSDLISFTADKAVAESIATSVLEMRDVARGEITAADLIEKARTGADADRPYLENAMGYWQHGWKAGDPIPQGVQDAINEEKSGRWQVLVRDEDRMRSILNEEDGPGNWQPDPTTKIDHVGIDAWSRWSRPMTEDEARDAAVDIYKITSTFREHAGGVMNPLFFSSDTKALANIPASDIGVVTVAPSRPGARGEVQSALGEWRTISDAVKITSIKKGITASAAQVHTGIMVALHVDPDTAKALALTGGEPPEQLHVTLAYLGKTDDPPNASESEVLDALRQLAKRHAPVTGEVGGHGRFSNKGEGVPLILLPDLPTLPALRDDLISTLDDVGAPANQKHGYTPHITLQYLQPGENVSIGTKRVGTPLSFDHVTLSWGDNRTDISLSGVTASAEFGDTPGHPFRGNQWVDGGYTDGEGNHWSAISKYGVAYSPKNADKPEVKAANAFKEWDQLPTTPFRLSDQKINGQESHVKDKSIDKVVSGKEALREGYDPHILIDSKGDAYVIDGHHRVAMYTGLQRDVMPSKVLDLRKSKSAEFGESAGHPFRGNQYTDGETGGDGPNLPVGSITPSATLPSADEAYSAWGYYAEQAPMRYAAEAMLGVPHRGWYGASDDPQATANIVIAALKEGQLPPSEKTNAHGVTGNNGYAVTATQAAVDQATSLLQAAYAQPPVDYPLFRGLDAAALDSFSSLKVGDEMRIGLESFTPDATSAAGFGSNVMIKTEGPIRGYTPAEGYETSVQDASGEWVVRQFETVVTGRMEVVKAEDRGGARVITIRQKSIVASIDGGWSPPWEELGESAGHPFRGNQWKDGESGSDGDKQSLRPDGSLTAYNGKLNVRTNSMSEFPPEIQTKIVAQVENKIGVSLEEGAGNLHDLLQAAKENGSWEAGMTWYQDNHDMAAGIAERTGVPLSNIVGALAVSSPGMDWDTQAVIVEAMAGLTAGKVEFSQEDLDKANVKLEAFGIEPIKNGDEYKDLDSRAVRAMWMQNKADPDGPPWGVPKGFAHYEKAFSCLKGDNPDDVLNGVKVRSFYNNLMDPSDERDVTIDIQMVQAFANDTKGANDSTVMGAPSYKTVTIGPTPAIADVVRSLADQEGILPQQVQAIIWSEWKLQNPPVSKR